MKTKTQDTIEIPSKFDDHDKRLKDYDIRIGTWNVHSHNKFGACIQLTNVLMKSVSPHSENATDRTRMQKVSICDVYYSGHIDKHELECEVMVNKRLHHLVSEFTRVNEKIATIRIREKFYYISLICTHARRDKRPMWLKMPSTLN